MWLQELEQVVGHTDRGGSWNSYLDVEMVLYVYVWKYTAAIVDFFYGILKNQ